LEIYQICAQFKSIATEKVEQFAHLKRLISTNGLVNAINNASRQPLPLPSNQPKKEANIHRYISLTGSIVYIDRATQPNIAKPHSKLAEF